MNRLTGDFPSPNTICKRNIWSSGRNNAAQEQATNRAERVLEEVEQRG